MYSNRDHLIYTYVYVCMYECIYEYLYLSIYLYMCGLRMYLIITPGIWRECLSADPPISLYNHLIREMSLFGLCHLIS
jgi:hypothetical protein